MESHTNRFGISSVDYAREQSYPTPFQFSPMLPLLLISLATQKHSPLTKSTFKSEYDYIIVGAGVAGSIVASRLSEIECVSVLLLEAGKAPPLLTEVPSIAKSFWFTDFDWQYSTAPQKHTGRAMKNRRITWPSGKGIGGSSLINAMLYFRGNHRNYDSWAKMGAIGWDWRAVLPFFKKAENNEDPEFVTNGFHGVDGPMTVKRFPVKLEFTGPVIQAQKNLGYRFIDANGRRQIGSADFQGNIRNGQRCSTAKAYLVPAQNRTNLDIVPEAFVTKILFTNRRAYGVQFVHSGRRHVVRAKREIILSAGTVNSAQLMMVSGIGPADRLHELGIPLVANLPVGRNFQDHCGVSIFFVVNGSRPTVTERLMDPANINQYIHSRSGILAVPEAIFGISFLRRNHSTSPTYEPDYELYMLESQLEKPNEQSGLTKEAYEQFMGPYENRSIVLCTSQVVRQRIPGHVDIRSANAFDHPVIDPNYLADRRDMKDIVSGLKACRKIFKSPEMQRLGIEPFKTVYPGCEAFIGDETKLFRCFARSTVDSLSHPVGTAKMGDPADQTTVVDPTLRVKGVTGLRVVDASVMPTIPNGNTCNPVTMIAEKASNIIKQLIYCP